MCRDITKEIDFDKIELDPEIKEAVKILNQYGIETFQSCQGSEGHCYHQPTIEFYGDKSEGFKALDIALKHGFNVENIIRYWSIEDGEPVGPQWRMTFMKNQPVIRGL